MPTLHLVFTKCKRSVGPALLLLGLAQATAAASYFRINQVGYLPGDQKVAVIISTEPIAGAVEVWDSTIGRAVRSIPTRPLIGGNWGGQFTNFAAVDLTKLTTPGRYYLRLKGSEVWSREFSIGPYPTYQDDLLSFMRQQRCGYNPYLDHTCHLQDGMSVYGPWPEGTFVDAVGGWHDAGDQLKYLITASNATARMILAWELEPKKFADTVDALGRPRPNSIPDVLDEAYWGLVWMHKLHPAPDLLIHQVADDRDHRGFKLPYEDNADYGWGRNSFRPAYFADGRPQGLREWKSKSTGVANIAGRSAAAMAMAYRVWGQKLRRRGFAEKCLKAAVELYQMGKRQEGFQQGNSYGAPYRYNEITWADDMEWAAAELYRATQDPLYLSDAKRYADIAATTSWMEYDGWGMGTDMSRHYEMYPFTNIGHFALYSIADSVTKKKLAGYYRSGIRRIVSQGKANPYGIGVPFLWCSNNLVVAFITQVLLYERMTGDMRYHASMLAHRDWLFGRNPWGTSMFEGIPAGGVYPEDTHLPTVQILKRQVPGGLVDGPIAMETYKGLRGLTLTRSDEFAEFQTDKLVYHDDVGDYSTNEPTMDGTADAILMMATLSQNRLREPVASLPLQNVAFTYDHGAITRGDTTRKRLALVFTGDEFGEGANTIATTLQKHRVKASFFLTGRFYRNAAFRSAIERLRKQGNYLGAHSDGHLLYADWNDRAKTLVTRAEFTSDLEKNHAEMRKFGIGRSDARYFLPPFEWYNRDIAAWTIDAGLKLINFTPGTRSNADYTTLDDKNYVTSDTILARIKEYEAKDAAGLNGFILLMHIGAGPKRPDKFFDRLDELIGWLKLNHYEMVRVDVLLK